MRKALRILALLVGLGLLAFAAALVQRARQSRTDAPTVDSATILTTGQLPPCPSTPTCVSSQAGDPQHAVEPFELDPSRDEAPRAELERLLDVARAAGGTVVDHDDRFAHLTFSTPLLGFVDDVYLLLDAAGSHIDVRSASRVGDADLGTNRERVESLRQAFNDA